MDIQSDFDFQQDILGHLNDRDTKLFSQYKETSGNHEKSDLDKMTMAPEEAPTISFNSNSPNYMRIPEEKLKYFGIQSEERIDKFIMKIKQLIAKTFYPQPEEKVIS